jgi:hypothetical protein
LAESVYVSFFQVDDSLQRWVAICIMSTDPSNEISRNVN